MALTSRLELEVDSGGAEQKVVDMRKALEALEAVGLRVSSTMQKESSEFGNLALALSRAQAANDKSSASTEKSTKAVDDAAKAAAAQRKELDALLGSINPLTKQLNQLAAQETALIKARDSGQINLATYESYNQKLQENLNALTGATKAQKALSESVDEAKARILAVAQASVDSAQAQRNLTNTAIGLSEAEQGIVISSSAVVTGNSKIASSSDKVAAAVKQATQTTRAQADSLGDLLASIDPTTKALNRLDEQESQLARQKKIGAIDDETFNKYQTKIDQTRQALTRFDDGLNRTGNTAKQTAAALRGVPAQFTDIFISLQGGQAPLTVFLQQGGQLKDMFGGIGPAAKALGGYILGLINPLTVAAAAAAALAYGAYEGSKEFSEYQKALTLTGGFAGVSAGQLNALAESIGNVNGTTGLAAETLASLAASGKIAGDSFDEIAVAAISMNQATGKAVQDTISEFVKIAEDPVKAAITLNDQYHFLTASVYEQIVSLKEQGKEQGAVKLLTDTYAITVKSRAGQIVEDLGYVETAWKAVKTMTLGAVDGLKEFGRQKTIQSQIEQLDGQIKSMQRIDDMAAKQIGLSDEQLKRYRESAGYDAEKLKAWTAQRATLQEQIDSEIVRAKAQRDAQDREKASINAIDSLHTSYLAGLDKESKKKLDIAELDRQRAAALKGEGVNVDQINKEYDVALKAINDRYKDAKVAAPAVDLTGFNDAENALKALSAGYDNAFRLLDASEKAGLINADEYALQKGALLEKEKSQVESAYQAEIAALEAVSAKASTTSAQRIGIDQKIADARAKMVDTLQKLDTDQEVLSQQTSARNARDEASFKAFSQSVQDSLALAQQGLDNQIAGVGLGQQGRQRLQDDLKIRQDYQKQIEKLDRDYRNITDPTSGQTDNYHKETQLLKDALEERLTAQQNYYRQVDAAQADWVNGANAALQDYIDETRNISGQTYTLFSDSLHGVEDAFVDAATTGKLSFKDLADSIISDLARIVAKAYIVTPVLAALGIGGDAATGAGAAGGGLLSGLTGGKGLSGALSNISSVVSVAGSKFGQTVLAGWNGSDGIIGGLQGALSNGADYFKSVVTSAFETGSATAASIFSSETTSAALSQGYANYAAQFGTGVAGQGAFNGALGSAVSGQSAASGLASLSSVLSYIGAAYSVISSFQNYGVKGGATTAGFAAGGAYLGSLVGPIGTAAGAAIGSVLGSFVSGKLFGGSGEKYPDLSTSSSGNYINGQYVSNGPVQSWQTKAPKFGSAMDAQVDGIVAKFTSTLGMLYDVLGNGADVYAYDLMQVRKTSGKYSTTFGATLDDGTGVGLDIHQQFNAADAAAALQHNYDDVLGTFLAKAIVSSKSLPDYFKAQFTEFAGSWDTTADEVIKAIEGVFTRFNGVNDALSLININNLKLDNTGLMASDSILNLIGGISDLDTTTATAKEKVDALNTAVGTYYKAFFSADEQFEDLTKNLQNALGNLGVKLPDTRSAYRQMVEDIDVTTAAGQAMFATLVGLAQNADSYYSTLDQKAKAAQQAAEEAAQAASQAAADAAKKIADALMKGVTDGYSALQRAISAQQKATTDAYNARTASLNDMLSTVNSKVSDLTGISNDLESAMKSLRGSSDDTVKMLRGQAQATLQNALATARSGGSLAGFAGLADALDTIGTNNTDLYASLEDFNRDQGRTASVVAELNALNGKQLTSAEQSVKTLQDQLDQAKKAYDAQMAQYDNQLAIGQKQIDALNGVDTSVISVADAVNRMNAAVVAALSGLPGSGAGSATANTWENNASLVHTAYQTAFGRDADEGGLRFWTDALQSGSLRYDQLIAELVKIGRANGESIKVPGFASGGNFGGGIRLVGERGPEIELTGSSKILNARQTADALNGGGSMIVVALRALADLLEDIKANTQAGALSGNNLVKLLNRVTDGGNAMLTKELA